MSTQPCAPHPDSRVWMLQGTHWDGCVSTTCAGCVGCGHDHTRPTQRPASTSDARKRNEEVRRV